MADIKELSIDELRSELQRREAEPPEPPPEVLTEPDWKPLIQCITEGVEQSVRDGYEDDNFQHYVYEAALVAVFGHGYWRWRRSQAFGK